MNRMAAILLLAIVLFAFPASAEVGACACDPRNPETMKERACGFWAEAEKAPVGQPVFFLKDINPRKPNRWLALPRAHGKAHHPLSEMAPEDRAQFWTAAIEKAKELWGDQWGIALNGDLARTQCHAHVHLGKLVEGVETDQVITVAGPADIPAPKDGTGLWVHPHGKQLHVHLGEQIAETVLLR